MLLTIFTPVYNRANLLERTYQSLLAQSDYDFEWILVNDGSNDNGATSAVIESIVRNHTAPFPIVTVEKENGGKHRAVNIGVRLARGEWFQILDSDDALSPDAVEIIRKRTNVIKGRNDLMGFVGLKVTIPDGKTTGTPFEEDSLECSYDYYRNILGITGDRAEVIRTDVMREFPFPEIEGEKFLSEAAVWLPMGAKYNAVFTNDPIYRCEYLPEGLSRTIKRLVYENPVGAMLNSACQLRFNTLGLKQRLHILCQWEKRRRRVHELGRKVHPDSYLIARDRRWLPLAKLIVSLAGLLR